MLQASSPCACAPELPTALHTHTRACSPIKQLYQRDSQTDGQTLFTIHTYIHGPDTYMYSTHSFARTLLYPPGIELRRRHRADSLYSLHSAPGESLSSRRLSRRGRLAGPTYRCCCFNTASPASRRLSPRESVSRSLAYYIFSRSAAARKSRAFRDTSLSRSLARTRARVSSGAEAARGTEVIL